MCRYSYKIKPNGMYEANNTCWIASYEDYMSNRLSVKMITNKKGYALHYAEFYNIIKKEINIRTGTFS